MIYVHLKRKDRQEEGQEVGNDRRVARRSGIATRPRAQPAG